MAFTRYKGGRLPAHPDETHPRLWVDDFIVPDLGMLSGPGFGAAIEDVDYGSAITSWPMDLNDSLGDCGIAGADHGQMAWNQYATGSHQSWGDEIIEQVYSAVGGYVPGDPSTDNGIVLQDMLDYWRKTGVMLADGTVDKIAFFGAMRPGSWNRARRVLGIRTFGGLYKGYNLPESAEQAFPGDWVLVPGSPAAGGHCTWQTAEYHTTDEGRDISWGQPVKVQKAFMMASLEEVWVIGSHDFVEVNGRNPSGIDLEGMNEALSALTGQTNAMKLPGKIL